MTHTYGPLFHTRSLVKLVSWIIILPFYIYALLKWHQFKGHFLIQKRFPKISIWIFCIAFLGQTISLIEDWLYDHNISNPIIDYHATYLVLSLSFSISGLVLFRINLIYLKWKSLQPLLLPTSSKQTQLFARANNDSNSSSIPSINTNKLPQIPKTTIIPNIKSNSFSLSKAKEIHIIRDKADDKFQKVYSSNLSLTILFFIFIGSVIAYLSYTLSLSVDIAYLIVIIEFAVLWIMILLSILNIKHKKVEEGTYIYRLFYFVLLYDTYFISSNHIFTPINFYMLQSLHTFLMMLAQNFFIIFCSLKRHKYLLKTGIGCIKECYAVLVSLLVQMTLQILIPYGKTNNFNAEQLLQYSTFFVLIYQGFITLYTPLALLLKSEGTLNIKKYQNETDDKVFQNNGGVNDNMNNCNNNNNMDDNDNTEIIYDIDAQIIANTIDLPQLPQLPVVNDIPNDNEINIDNNNNNNNLPQIPNDNKANDSNNNTTNNGNNASIFVRKCLFQFLYRNESNHSIFSDYLRFCFAIENLLFVERVSIFYQLVVQLQKKYELSLILTKSPAMNPTLQPTLTNNPSTSFDDMSMTISQLDMSRISAVYIDDKGLNMSTNGPHSSQRPPASELLSFPSSQPNSNMSHNFSHNLSNNTSNQNSSRCPSPTMTPVTPIPNSVHWSDLKKGNSVPSSNNGNNNGNNNGIIKYIYRFEFEYLKNVYNHYESVIDHHHQRDNNNSKIRKDAGQIFIEQHYDVAMYKHGLYAICKEIYDQFIDNKAVSQVLSKKFSVFVHSLLFLRCNVIIMYYTIFRLI